MEGVSLVAGPQYISFEESGHVPETYITLVEDGSALHSSNLLASPYIIKECTETSLAVCLCTNPWI